jgi:two-component system chemotaxis response regulator CheB
VTQIRIAVVDDSSFIRKALSWMLAEEPGLTLVGTAARGEELLENLQHWRADLIILDLAMPGMGGLATLEEILLRSPTPVIILSDNLRLAAPAALEALYRGALDVIDKRDFSLVDFEAMRKVVVGRIRQLVRARPAGEAEGRAPAASVVPTATAARAEPAGGPHTSPALVLIGASTGGPPAVERILRDLGARLSCPIVVAQHMPAGFTRAFASRLASHLPFDVREVADGEPLLGGTVYVAPGGMHTTVEKRRDGLFARLTASADRVQPSVDALFSSAAAAVGPRAVAALLTGMGDDGALGMAELARAGSYTLAQDEATSAVFGMPRAAIDAGAVRETLPLSLIGERLRQLAAAALSDASLSAVAGASLQEGVPWNPEKY